MAKANQTRTDLTNQQRQSNQLRITEVDQSVVAAHRAGERQPLNIPTKELPITKELSVERELNATGGIANVETVRELQVFLNQMGRTKFGDKWVALKEDNILGPKTKAAAAQLEVEIPEHLLPKPKQVAGQVPGAGAPDQQGASASMEGGIAAEPAPPAVHDPQQWLSDNYKDIEPYLQIPELAEVITKAAQEGYTDQQFVGAVMATNWWKQTQESVRKWQTMLPAEQEARLVNRRAAIRVAAESEGLILNDADINDLATKYEAQGWNDAVLRGQLRSRPEYSGRSDTDRKWSALITTNPAEAVRQRTSMQSRVTLMGQAMGVALSQTQVASLAEQALINGWDEATLKNNVAISMTQDNAIGSALVTENQLNKIAQEWGFFLSPGEANTWMQRVALGTFAPEDFQAELQQRAMSVWAANPALAEAIGRGVSPGKFYQPYAKVIEDELGVPADQQDWRDPKFLVAMNFTDPKTQQQRPMNVNEWQKQIRTNDTYGWRYSKRANDMADTLDRNILTMFGQVA